jgi:N-acetylglucosamine-6-phosphate deacetylase
VASALVAGERIAGDVIVDGDRVRDVGVAPAGSGGTAVPGFVDLQVNGFAGVDFTTADLDGYRAASTAMARHGVTTFFSTIPTAHPDRYTAALTAATEAHATSLPGARVGGVHLEGPFLSPVRKGAHNADWLRRPDKGLADQWLAAGPVAIMTLAPELDGALDLIEHLRRRGIVVSLGHTDADAAQAHAGFDAGASMVTHLWNAQRPIASRDPAVGGTALARSDVFVGIIADLVHVARETLTFSIAAAGDRFVLVTDAVDAAGVTEEAVRLPDGTLAGSACPMDVALRNLLSCGLPMHRAVAACTIAPSRVMHDDRIGQLHPDGAADIVVVDDGLTIERVLIAGSEIKDQDA